MSSPGVNKPVEQKPETLRPFISERILASISVKLLLLEDKDYLVAVAAAGRIMAQSLAHAERIFFCGYREGELFGD